jgi:fluoroquinolone transport system permease protein
LDQAALQQIGLVDILHGVARLADSGEHESAALHPAAIPFETSEGGTRRFLTIKEAAQALKGAFVEIPHIGVGRFQASQAASGLVDPLTDPHAHGGDPADSFDVVIPSLPGFGFSSRPTEVGWGLERIGRAWDVLMKRLGYRHQVREVVRCLDERRTESERMPLELTLTVLRWTDENLGGGYVVASNMQDAVLVELAAKARPGVDVLFLDTATFGVFFLAALMLYERTEGALQSLQTSPLGPARYVVAKFATLSTVAVVAAIPITVAAARQDLGAILPTLGFVLLGVALTSVFFLAMSLLLVIPHRTITGFLAAAPWSMAPLVLAPLLWLTGLVSTPLMFAVPTVGGAELIRHGLDAAAAAWPPGGPVAVALYLAACSALVLVAAHRRHLAGLDSGPPSQPAPRASRATVARVRRARFTPNLAGLVRLDLRNLRGDPLLLVALAGPVLLALALRLGYPAASGLIADRFGVDLAPHRPVVLAALVLLHVPMVLGMVASLLLLDDIDDGHLRALRATPLPPRRYRGFRVGRAAVASLVSLAVCLPLSGLASGFPAVMLAVAAVLASAQASLVVLATVGFAGNKVEGLAMLKLIGGVMIAAPVAAWWVSGWATWLLGLAPVTWPAHALWAQSAPELIAAALAGTATTAAAAVLLARRVASRLARMAI